MQNTKPIEFEVFQFRNETKTLKNVQVVIERISETFIEELFLNSRNKMCFYFKQNTKQLDFELIQ